MLRSIDYSVYTIPPLAFHEEFDTMIYIAKTNRVNTDTKELVHEKVISRALYYLHW